jgi:hypothetical protein
METKSEFMISTDGQASLEIATIGHNGKEYSAMGAYISDDYVVGYISKAEPVEGFPNMKPQHWLTTWEGEKIGRAYFVSTWRLSISSYISSTMSQIEVNIAGKVFTGRGYGVGMVWKGKAKKGKR